MAEWNVEQHTHSASQAGWPDRLHAVFKRHAIKQVGYVADTGIARLIDLCERDNDVTEVALSSEAEGAGLVLGAALGGERAALLMQSSGVGNCINTFSILKNCADPLRAGGVDARRVRRFQFVAGADGQHHRAGAEAVRLPRLSRRQAKDVEPVTDAACRMAFGGGNMQVAILLSQRMVDRTKPKGH